MPLIARVGVILLGVIALSVGFHLHRHPTSQQNGRTKTVALQNGRDGSNRDINRDIYSNSRSSIRRLLRLQQSGGSSEVDAAQTTTEGTEVGGVDRKELWKKVSKLERRAVELLAEGSDASVEEAVKLLAESVTLKRQDPFIALAESYGAALDGKESGKLLADEAAQRILEEMKQVNVPPHLAALSKKGLGVGANGAVGAAADGFGADADLVPEDVDPGSTFSDTVTEKIRVKVNSFYDADKSDPANGKFMFWYKVGIYNEGSEPVQVVARMWEIEKCRGEKETVRGAGIMSTQPIIPPGDVFTYQSVCPLKLFPPRGKRILGSMSGAYTMCKGNMGQHNFAVKISKFNLILPEDVATAIAAGTPPGSKV